MNRGEHLFVPIPGILQIEHHGVADEQSVFRLPRLRRDAQHGVLERPRPQRGQTGIDAGGIGVDQFAMCRRQQGQGFPRQRPKTVNPRLAVDGNGRLAKEFSQFPCGPPSGKVHLEEPVLRMQVAQRSRHVPAGGAVDGRYARGIAFHGDAGGKSRQGRRAVELREAAAREPPQPSGRQGDADQQKTQDTDQQTKAK